MWVCVMFHQTKIIMISISFDEYPVMFLVNCSYAMYTGLKTLHVAIVRVCTLTETLQYIPSVLLMRHSKKFGLGWFVLWAECWRKNNVYAEFIPRQMLGEGLWGFRKSIQWWLIGESGEWMTNCKTLRSQTFPSSVINSLVFLCFFIIKIYTNCLTRWFRRNAWSKFVLSSYHKRLYRHIVNTHEPMMREWSTYKVVMSTVTFCTSRYWNIITVRWSCLHHYKSVL